MNRLIIISCGEKHLTIVFFCKTIQEPLNHAVSLERAAHITLCVVQELKEASETVSLLTKMSYETTTESSNNVARALPPDSERAQCVLKLAPRIRRLEADVTSCLLKQMETMLQAFASQPDESSLWQLGHVMRGLALLGRGKDVESVFCRIAILPLLRARLSMGRLDEGGARGECAGLKSLLDQVLESIAKTYGSLLVFTECMLEPDVDLLCNGVWVSIVTSLMADTGIQMAIFSPGIASILQSNYVTLDKFVGNLASKLLSTESTITTSELYYRPEITNERKKQAQERIYAHPKTVEFSKKWNLPIYYQLRFGESCNILNKAIEQTSKEGWISDVFSGSEEEAVQLKKDYGFELSLFLELYHILLSLWRPDVILRPLTNRFLRGAVQLINRTLTFITESMDGKIKFGNEPSQVSESDETDSAYPTRAPYCWGDSEQDLAAVAWELAILESCIKHDYVDTICTALETDTTLESDRKELRGIISEILNEATDQFTPLIEKAWNDLIVTNLTQKCSGPLAAVKGVAATYRMTNRPPPTQASPFVSTILRPLKEFNDEFSSRIPDQIGSKWKHEVVSTVADRYASAVDDLLATVQRTEAALKSRKMKRTSTGGMSDGEKVKLQVFFDYEHFLRSIREMGLDPASIIGVSKLKQLTAEGESLRDQVENGT